MLKFVWSKSPYSSKLVPISQLFPLKESDAPIFSHVRSISWSLSNIEIKDGASLVPPSSLLCIRFATCEDVLLSYITSSYLS